MVMGWDNDAVWMRWRPEEGTRLHLVTLDGSKVGVADYWETWDKLPCLLLGEETAAMALAFCQAAGCLT
jgi:hypothetical protein